MIPTTMTQVTVDTPGGPEAMRLTHGAPVPVPGRGEALIRVRAAGVNRPDIIQRRGAYPPPKDASPVLGLEVAGEIVALGTDGDESFEVGDPVCALVNGGGYAEFCTAPLTQCLPWPRGYDAIRAAALPETFFTVWANLFAIGRLAAGESVLIHGGSSGIGTTAIQLARERGAKVFVTAGSTAKCAACEGLGATAINYRETEFAAEIARLTDGRGVDVVLDMVGAPYAAGNIKCLARDGRLVIIAFLHGSVAEAFDLAPVMIKRLTVTGSTMRPRTAAEKGEIATALLTEVWPLLDGGRIAPVMQATFPLAEVVDAHRLMEEGSHIGKIVLTLDP